jgi:hypothetical protein
MSDSPKKFSFHYGDQGTLSEGLFDDIEKVVEKYSDVMTLAGIIGVLEAVKFSMYMDSFVNYVEGDDDDGEDSEDLEEDD